MVNKSYVQLHTQNASKNLDIDADTICADALRAASIDAKHFVFEFVLLACSIDALDRGIEFIFVQEIVIVDDCSAF